jgi:hypothetical protein
VKYQNKHPAMAFKKCHCSISDKKGVRTSIARKLFCAFWARQNKPVVIKPNSLLQDMPSKLTIVLNWLI